MSIVFYAAPMSSAVPVACALDELAISHERVEMNLAAGDQRKPEFLKLNPNGKVPTLVADGTPMFEALAIMQWLGDRYGVERRLWPAADAPARLTAMSWSTWAYVTYRGALQRFIFAQGRVEKELHSKAQAAYARNELSELVGVLDGSISAAPYLLGEDFSLADLIVANVIYYGEMCGATVSRDLHPRAADWLARCTARPSFRKHWA